MNTKDEKIRQFLVRYFSEMPASGIAYYAATHDITLTDIFLWLEKQKQDKLDDEDKRFEDEKKRIRQMYALETDKMLLRVDTGKMTKEDYICLSKERLAEMLVARDKQPSVISYTPFEPR